MHSVGHEVVTGGADSNVMYWNLEKKQQLCLHGHYNTIQSVHLFPQHSRIVSSGGDHFVRVWRYGKKEYEEVARKNFITKINGVVPLGQSHALSYGNDNKVTLWDIEKAAIARSFADVQEAGSVEKCAAALNDSSFFVSTDHKSVKLWDVERGSTVLVIGEDQWKPEIQKPNRAYEISALCLSGQNLLFTGERR